MSCDLVVGTIDWSSHPLSQLGHEDLEAMTPRRANPDEVPRRRGVVAHDEWEGERVDEFPVMIYGDSDLAGTPASDRHRQVRLNVKAVRQAIRHSHADALVAQFTVDSVDYEAEVRAMLRGTYPSDQHFRGQLQLNVPAGYWHKATADTFTSASSSSTRTFTVTNDGSLDLYDAVIELSGAATAVTLTNQSFGDGPSVTFTGSLGTLTTLTCGTKDADRDGSPVHGLVDHDGHDAWLPLLAGDNTIEVAPTGGAVAVDVAVQPAW